MPGLVTVPNDWAVPLREALPASTSGTFEPIPLVSAAGMRPGSTVPVRIEDELVLIFANGTLDPTGVRGWEGSAAPTHASGVEVRAVWTEATLNALRANLPAPRLHGWKAWTLDPQMVGNTGSTTSSGSIIFCRIPVEEPFLASQATMYFSAAGASLTYARLGIYSLDGVLLGQTADQITAWQSTGEKAMVITAEAGQSLLLTEDVYAAYISIGTTQPAVVRGVPTTSLLTQLGTNASEGWRSCFLTGQTGLLPTVTLSSLSAHSLLPLIGLE